MQNPVAIILRNLKASQEGFKQRQTLKPMLALTSALKCMLKYPLKAEEHNRFALHIEVLTAHSSRLPEVKEHASGKFKYKQGQEKQLLAQMIPVIKAIHEARKKGQPAPSKQPAPKQQTQKKLDERYFQSIPEDFVMPEPAPEESEKRAQVDSIRQRKLRIDQNIKQAQKELAAGKMDEAKALFREAVNLHVDEDAMYLIIATKLQESDFYKESFEYLRHALTAAPDNRKACEMVVEACNKGGSPDRGFTLLKKIADKKGATPHLLYAMASLKESKRLYDEAVEFANQAIELDDSLMDAKKLIRRVKKKAAKAKGN